MIRTLGLVTAKIGQPTPVVLAAAYYTSTNLATPGVVIAAQSFSILKGIATIVLGAANLPKIGYNGPNGYPSSNATTGSKFDIVGGISGQNNAGGTNQGGNSAGAGGQQVTLWGFATATYFNGKRITVLDCNPANGSFRFYFNHADVTSTNDTGNTAPSPVQRYRAIRLECSQNLDADLIYVGDANVSATQYMACLSLTGQIAVEIASENIPPEGLFIDTNGTASTDQCLVTVLY